jgi:hypothetical protein
MVEQFLLSGCQCGLIGCLNGSGYRHLHALYHHHQGDEKLN